jgi:hypothetical protein
VDYQALAEHGEALDALRAEFEHAEDAMAGLRSAVGHDQLAAKLEDFAGNWSDKRGEITESLRVLADFATGAAAIYADTELQLASAIAGAAGPQASGRAEASGQVAASGRAEVSGQVAASG